MKIENFLKIYLAMEFFKCKRCGVLKTRQDFYRDHRSANGFKKICKSCVLYHQKIMNKKKKMKKIEVPPSYCLEQEDIKGDPDSFLSNPIDSSVEAKRKREEESTNLLPNDDDPKSNKIPKIDTADENQPITKSDLPFFKIEQEWEPVKQYAVVLDGSRDSGKTTLLRHHFQFWKSKYDIILFFCQNPQSVHYDWLDEDFKSKWMFLKWEPAIVKILERFQNETKNALRILLIGDDIMDRSNKFSDALRQTYLRGRNIGMSVILSGQSPMLFEPDIRGNCDFYIAGDHHGPEMKEKALRTFISGYVTLPEEIKMRNKTVRYNWCAQWLEDHTKDHWFVIVNYRKKTVLCWNRDFKE